MKMYETYESTRDACNKYFDSPDSGLISYFLSNEYYPEGGRNANPVDYMREFQGNSGTVESTATSKHLIFRTDPDEGADDWKRKDLKDWTSNDVLHWIANVAENQRFPYEFINAPAFNVDGKTLLSLSKKEFLDSDEKYGSLLYNALHKSLPKFEEISTSSTCKSDGPKNDVNLETLSTTSHLSDALLPFTGKSGGKGSHYGPEPFPTRLPNSPESYPFDLNSNRTEEESSLGPEDGDRNNSDGTCSSDTEPGDGGPKKSLKKTGPGKRQPGRPPGMKTRKDKPEKKTGRLWEFIRDLLLDPQHCPSVICWENHDDGVFRFVKSEKVAKIWGDRKGNEKMNYEKLSRAMRYYYRSKVLQPVLGRRLVYKFGPTARGWKTENPNFRH